MSRDPPNPPVLDTNGDLEHQLHALYLFVAQIEKYRAANGISTRSALTNAMYASDKRMFWDNVCFSTHPGLYKLEEFYTLMYETIEDNYEQSTISSSSSTSTSSSYSINSDSEESIADEIDNDYATQSYSSDG
jgi:hypothetical protein